MSYLASRLDSFAECSGGRLRVEGVRHEQILRGVHDERTTPHVAPDTQKRQVTDAAFYYGGSFLKI